jgi:O-antigen/teichoic acid export membrane protein|tara:strand:- start:7517 stop:8728 length:1212 start_codon:yes stop_codon:yes gene_type:complete
MLNNWKQNTVYISLMQLTLLIVNFFVITLISREYGPESYGEYASSKSLSVLVGTATVMSLALVTTKYLAKKNENSKFLFSNSYFLIIRNFLIALIILLPVTLLFKRDISMTALFLTGFVVNEMIHVALAYFQAKGDFVTSSKQIFFRTIIYGIGAWIIVNQGFSIISLIAFQVLMLASFFVVAHLSIPSKEIVVETKSGKAVRNDLQKSGKKMVLTTFSSALISELDIVLLGLFYSGSVLGVLAWSRRILEIIFQLLAASLDILFPELSKAKDRNEVSFIRSKLTMVFYASFIIPVTYFIFKDFGSNLFVSLLGDEFDLVSEYTYQILFCIPLMVWSRINIIFSRALNFEINLTKTIIFGSVLSYVVYFAMHRIGTNPAVLSIIFSQVIIAGLTTFSFRRSYE